MTIKEKPRSRIGVYRTRFKRNLFAMTKIVKSNEKRNRHGGLEFIFPYFRQNGIENLVDSCLGVRVKQSTYSIFDVISSHILSNLAGAGRIAHLKKKSEDLKHIRGAKIPSISTTSRVLRSLATENKIIPPVNGTLNHTFNSNPELNDLLIRVALRLKNIHKHSKFNVLDYDNSVIETKKWDATKTYKRRDDKKHSIYGYQPGFATLNDVPVYVQGRSGHSTARTAIDKTLIEIIETLEKHNISIRLLRSDSAAYNNKLIRYCELKDIKYVLRNPTSEKHREAAIWEISENDWEEHVDREHQICQLASTWKWIKHSHQKETWTKARLVIKRTEDFKGKKHHSFVVTNDWASSNAKILNLYNERGKQEKFFGESKDDWNIKKPPFSYLEENTVFWIIQCIGYNFYKYILSKTSKTSNVVCEKWYLRNFRAYVIDYIATYHENGIIDISTESNEIIELYKALEKGMQ